MQNSSHKTQIWRIYVFFLVANASSFFKKLGMKYFKSLIILLICTGLNAQGFRKVQQIKANGANVTLNLYQSEDNATIEFRALNNDNTPYNVEISMSLENMQANAALPFKGIIAANSTNESVLFKISRMDSAKGYFYRDLNWSLATGPVIPPYEKPVVHNGTYGYPWPKGKTYRIDNAFNGYGAHRGDYAYGVDFKMPEGSDICAARDGVVIAIETKFTRGGNDQSLADKANYIYIRHSDGSIGRYLHIRNNGAIVRVNDHVSAGQKIAYSGNVGWSTDPHLHFDVIVPKDQNAFKTIPFKFKAPGGKLIDPKVGIILSNSR